MSRSEPSSGGPDVVASIGLVLLAVTVALLLPDESALRAAVTLPVLLVAPGYLLLQALFVPARRPRTRLVHAVIAVGVSPALLGLLALSTATVPGGFQEGPILATVTGGCAVFAAVALIRRSRYASGSSPDGAEGEARAS